LLFIFFLIGILILELMASTLFGLGKVVLYASHPIYGYRPTPNQVVSRDGGKTTIKINNLSLRANQDWLESTRSDKTRVLFLGDSIPYGGSYIDNQDLFSTLAFKNNKNIETANAGVNAWGVLNVHGLIKNLDFMPADIYITVVPEGDFYRGLSRIGGQPFWTRAPRLAIEEAFQHLIYLLSLKKNAELNIRQLSYAEQEKIANLAALALKEYDLYLKNHHHQHYIFITPTQAEVVNNDKNDKLVQNALEKNQLDYIYIKNKIPNTLTQTQKTNLFHDSVHLSKTGHQLWAQIIEKEVKLN
jgi:hypothetical protein